MSSIIEKLKTEGVLVLHHDYRAGHLDDLSGNGNDGVITGAAFSKNGLHFTGTNLVTVSDSAELQLTVGTLIAFNHAGFSRHVNGGRLIQKRDGGGTNWDWSLATATINLYDGSATRTLTAVINNTKYQAVCFADTEKAEGFVDGVSDGEYNDVSSISVDDADIKIGNHHTGGSPLEDTLSAVLIINRELTATEHAELFAELEATKYPSKPSASAQANVQADLDDTALVGAWNMKPNGNKVIDLSASGNDGTIVSMSHEHTILGDALRGDNVAGYVDIGNAGVTVKTAAFWVNPASTTEDFMDLDGGTHTIEATAGTVTATGFSSPTIYVNGVEAATIVADLWQRIVITSTGFTASDLDLWKETIYLEGLGGEVELYSDEKDAAWVTTDYAKGANAVQFKSDWGTPVSVANVTAGFLEDTPFKVLSGSYKIESDTIGGEKAKVIRCVSSGNIVMSLSMMTPTEAARGTCEFWFNKTDTASVRFMIVAQADAVYSDASQNGYMVNVSTNENVYIQEVTGGSASTRFQSNEECGVGTWHKIKVTISGSGEFTIYLDDVLLTAQAGSNPFTDTSFTTGGFLSINLAGGEKIAYADISGNHSIVKKLLV